MGCHTWAYKKISALTKEEKDSIVSEFIESTSKWWGFKEKSINSITEKVKKWYKDQPELFKGNGKTPAEYAKDLVKEYTDKLNAAKTEGFDAVLRYTVEEIGCTVKKIGETEYWIIGFDAPFRIYGYPNRTFKDKEKLLKFLKSKSDSIGYYDNSSYEFVRGYSEELVKRINDYFKLHGEDNLYFEFG